MNCFLSRGSRTNANEREDALWKWWGREEESEGRRRAGWVGVWLSNKDFRRTSWKHRLKEWRGPEHRRKDLRLIQSVVQKWKRLLGRGSAVTEASLPSTVMLADWLTLPSTVWGLLAHLYTRSPTYLLPPTHCISYTHIDKGAAKLMLMLPLGCTCTALTLSGREQVDELWVAGANFQPPSTL